MPPVELEDRAVVVAEMPEQPPQPFGTAHVPVGDGEDAGPDARASGRSGEVGGRGKRMPASWPRFGGEVAVDVEKARTRDVALEVELASTRRIAELPPAIDELVAPAYQLPPGDGGSATEAGWMTYTIPPVALIQASSNCVRS